MWCATHVGYFYLKFLLSVQLQKERKKQPNLNNNLDGYDKYFDKCFVHVCCGFCYLRMNFTITEKHEMLQVQRLQTSESLLKITVWFTLAHTNDESLCHVENYVGELMKVSGTVQASVSS